MSMTYATLITQVLSYLDRTDLQVRDQVPNFINNAQARISRDAETLGFVHYVTTNFVAGQAIYSKEARWLRTLSWTFGTQDAATLDVIGDYRNPLLLRSYDYLTQIWPDRTQVGVPQYYADYGPDLWIVAPTPQLAYPYEVGVIESAVPLSITTQTNWLTNFAPDVLLYATLLETAPFLKVDERVPMWKAEYTERLHALKVENAKRLMDRQENVENG